MRRRFVRRRRREPARIEPPAWYVTFTPEDWDTPDPHETRMLAGSTGPWPDDLHHWHASRRWEQAKYAYRREHPALAEQEFTDLLGRRYGRLV
jgi:hypothetical protein